MDIFKTYLFFAGHDEGNSYLVDTIFYDEEWWLVASWLENKRVIPPFLAVAKSRG
jgi:hypothetical protein